MNNRVKNFFDKYFKFFSIPNFIPKSYFKKSWKKWKSYFKKRSLLKDLIDDKESILEALNINGILNAIGKIITNTDEESANLEKLISDFNTNENELKESQKSFESMLENIIEFQNNYGWKYE